MNSVFLFLFSFSFFFSFLFMPLLDVLCVLIGCACRFLYGPETKDDHKSQIEKSLDGKIELKLEVIFYKKNGKFYFVARIYF